MNIRIREANNINIIDVEGRIDINSSEIIESIGWLIKNKKNDILLNFAKVDVLDYNGISILAIAYKNVMNHRGKMKFCNVSLRIEELFKLVRLNSVFEIYKDEKTALKTFHFASAIDKKVLRRRFKRLPLHTSVEFCSHEKQENEKNLWHSGKVLNLSGDGLFLYAKNVLPIGKKIKLKINLRDKQNLEINGIVIWLADKSLQPQSYPGMGIYFKKMYKRDQDKVLTFINKRLTHRTAI